MTLKLILLLCFFAVIPKHLVKGIFGGRDAGPIEFPNMASIHGFKNHPNRTILFSSGVIYNEFWILVTGKCALLIDTIYRREHVRIHVGKSNLIEDSPYLQIRHVADKIAHSLYHKTEIGKSIDIGLIQLDEKLIFNWYVKAFPISQSEFYPKGPAIIAGWGNKNFDELSNGTPSSNLQVAEVKILPYNECKKVVKKILKTNGRTFYETSFDDYHFCTGSFEIMHGPSAGDTGGPLMQIDSEGDEYEVIGLISDGTSPSGIPGPTVYTHLGPFRLWLASMTKPDTFSVVL